MFIEGTDPTRLFPMTEIAEDRSWWADVEHLRPGAATATTPDRAADTGRWADADGWDGPGRPDDTDTDTPARPDDTDGSGTTPRRGRITGRPLPAATEPVAVLRRADAASFADAMDLDGAFGAPARRASRDAESREIVLSGRRGPAAAGVDDDARADPRPPVRGQGSPDRRTVRISGQPGIHAELAERRALREIERPRPRTSTVDRMGSRPDRVAMWAVVLGLFLVVLAAMSSSGIS